MENFIVARILDITNNGSIKKILNINLISEVIVLSPTTLSILMNNGRIHTVFIDENLVFKKFHSDLMKEI
jgi:hypothetical protein